MLYYSKIYFKVSKNKNLYTFRGYYVLMVWMGKAPPQQTHIFEYLVTSCCLGTLWNFQNMKRWWSKIVTGGGLWESIAYPFPPPSVYTLPPLCFCVQACVSSIWLERWLASVLLQPCAIVPSLSLWTLPCGTVNPKLLLVTAFHHSNRNGYTCNALTREYIIQCLSQANNISSNISRLW